MTKNAILSVLGHDRVGVADDLVAALGQRRVRVNRSRMTSLGDRFAALVDVSGDENDMARLRRELTTIGMELDFQLQLEPRQPTEWPKQAPPVTSQQSGVELLIESFSSEPFGLNAITGILRRRNANIEHLQTDVSSAPSASEMTFHTVARVKLPMACSVENLGKELHELEADRDLDIVIKRGGTFRRAELVDA